jgi:hypothetical protein
MSEQPDLSLNQMPEANAQCREWLEYYLREHGGWHTAAMVLMAGCREVTESNKRWIRELASGSAWVLSGQKGYCHLRHAKPEEISHAAAWLEHQAREMGERAARLRRAGHRLIA